MPRFLKEEQKGSPDGEGEFGLIDPSEFTGQSLEERWANIMSFIEPTVDPRAPPSGPGEEIGLPELPDIDFGDLGQEGLLRVIAETLQVQSDTQLSMLSTLFDIYVSVRGPRQITVVGAENTNDDQSVKEVLTESSPEDSVLTRKLFLRASNDNTGPIFFGDDQVQPQEGFVLNKGEMIALQTDIGRLGLYMVSQSDTQVVHILGMR